MATLHNAFPRLDTVPPSTRMPLGSTSSPQSRGLRQPQSRMTMSRSAVFLAITNEPEDAYLTGGTRSLDRRLLALNLGASKTVEMLEKFEVPLAS
jgi:hypothetical protein